MSTDTPDIQGKWWLGSILCPLATTAIGIAVGLLSPHRESDWIGVGFMIPFAVGSLVGCGCSVICAAISVWKKESLASLAVVCGMVSLGVLVFAASTFLRSLQR